MSNDPFLKRQDQIMRIIDPDLFEAKKDGRYDLPGSLWVHREKWAAEKAVEIMGLFWSPKVPPDGR